MKTLGSFLMVIGGIFLFWAMFIFDTSISVGGMGMGYFPSNTRVHNLGLMSDKRNYITISGIMFVVGLILFLFDRKQENQENHSVEVGSTNTQNEKLWNKSRDLNNDEYKVYLVKKYSIEKNNALEKVIANGKLFNNINDALIAMDEKDSSDQKLISNSTQVVGDLTELDLTSKTQNKFIESSGSIGDGAYPYVEYLDGAVVVENKSGGKIHYSSLQKAKQVLGN
jgi:hypothetical protein